MWAHLGQIMPHPWLYADVAAWVAKGVWERRTWPRGREWREEEEGRQQHSYQHRELGPFLQGAAGGQGWHKPARLI